MKGISLGGKEVHDDTSMARRVIAAESKKRDTDVMLRALRKERDMILDEFLAFRSARPVHKSPAKRRDSKAEVTRVSCGDFHGMMHDPAARSAFLEDLRRLNPDEIVFLGDMLECGGWLAKHMTIGYVALTDYSYQEDIRATGEFIDAVQKAAPDAVIHYIEGNHECRVERTIVDLTMSHRLDSDFLMSAFAPDRVLRLADRGIAYYRRSEIYVEGLPRGWIKLGRICFTHELGASKNAAREAVQKAAVNVRFGHTHRDDVATIVFPGVGICKAFNPGCLCLCQPVWKHSDPTSWSQGYDIDFVAKSGNFQAIHVPIWRGESLAGAMFDRFRS